MKSRPILFSAPMVRALLAGTKTQTRRIVKPSVRGCTVGAYTGHGRVEPVNVDDDGGPWDTIKCPYGRPGDHLWVRETAYYDLGEKFPKVMDDSVDMDAVYYRADGECCQQIPECQCADVGKPKWTPSILVPRWASRITLEITGVRVERLQTISEADAVAEGLESMAPAFGHGWQSIAPVSGGWAPPTLAYRELWESINGPGSWDTNPWVWCVSFKRFQP